MPYPSVKPPLLERSRLAGVKRGCLAGGIRTHNLTLRQRTALSIELQPVPLLVLTATLA